MFRTYRLGTLLGFPIEVNLSFLLMLGVVLLWTGGITGVFVVLLAFGSVLLHELGHALVARHLGVPVPGIELHFFGGAAKMGAQPRNAGDEIAIAAAGPAVSFALGGLGMLLAYVTGIQFFQLVGWINLVLGGFNLIPALPMDGGRIFRALLARRTGFARATEIAVKLSRVFAVAFAVIGIATMQLFLALLAFVVWTMGTAELRLSRRSGYRNDPSPVEVLPPGFGGAPRGIPVQRGYTAGGYVIRREGGRLYIEPI
jgi:Zn-dependent protease